MTIDHMRLWELRPRPSILTASFNGSPWVPLGDRLPAFIVRADSEDRARWLASQLPRGGVGFVWLDATLTTCVARVRELPAGGEAGIVVADPQVDWLSACCAASAGHCE
jgi:hypothetical protein